MRVPWTLAVAGARAPAPGLTGLDARNNEPYAASPSADTGQNTFADADAARYEFLQVEAPELDVKWAPAPSPPRLRHTPASIKADAAQVPRDSASAEAPGPDARHDEAGAAQVPRDSASAEVPGPDARHDEAGAAQAHEPGFLAHPRPRDEERILELTRDLFVQAPLLFIIPALAIASIVGVLGLLLRYLLSGLGAANHWSAQLTRRTDWSKLKDGAFVKVAGVAAAPEKQLRSPLGGLPCAAYRVSVAYDDGAAWVPLSTSEGRTGFHVLDEEGRALLISENDFHMYGVQTQEWTFPANAAPLDFLKLCDAKPDAGLRFREEVLAIGARVTCVGAVSRLRLEEKGFDTAGALRPAYAVLMFRDDRIPWAKMTDLAQGDWTQLAARVLVTAEG